MYNLKVTWCDSVCFGRLFLCRLCPFESALRTSYSGSRVLGWLERVTTMSRRFNNAQIPRRFKTVSKFQQCINVSTLSQHFNNVPGEAWLGTWSCQWQQDLRVMWLQDLRVMWRLACDVTAKLEVASLQLQDLQWQQDLPIKSTSTFGLCDYLSVVLIARRACFGNHAWARSSGGR